MLCRLPPPARRRRADARKPSPSFIGKPQATASGNDGVWKPGTREPRRAGACGLPLNYLSAGLEIECPSTGAVRHARLPVRDVVIVDVELVHHAVNDRRDHDPERSNEH